MKRARTPREMLPGVSADGGAPAGQAPSFGDGRNSLDDPVAKKQLRENLVIGLRKSIGQLFVANGLSDGQSDEACGLMVTQQMEMFDLLRPRPGGHPPPFRDVEQLRISQEAQLREMLGDKAFNAFNQSNRDRNASRVVFRLEESARASGIDFSSDQLDQMKTLLSKERVSRIDLTKLPPINSETQQDSQPAAFSGPPPELPENPVIQEARSVLTLEQLRLLEKVLKAPPTRSPRFR